MITTNIYIKKNIIWTPRQYSKHVNKSFKELTIDLPKQYGLGCQQGACSLTLLKKTESMFILEKGGNLRILSLENVNLLRTSLDQTTCGQGF
jgi:hypothetical protein